MFRQIIGIGIATTLSIPMAVVCQRYVYPIAHVSNACTGGSPFVLVMYQKTLTDTTLLAWDPITHTTTQLVDNVCNPVGVSLLPDGVGFSFLDKGRVRLAGWRDLAVQSLDFYTPLRDMGVVHWVTSDCGYTTAKRRDRIGIFQLTRQGTIRPLLTSIVQDYLYPQKIGDQLFYIERSILDDFGHCRYEIMSMKYPIIACKQTGYQPTAAQRKSFYKLVSPSDIEVTDQQLVMDFGMRPIMFLHMASDREGFVIEYLYEDEINKTCACCRVVKNGNMLWTSKRLFTWSMPSYLVQGENPERLCESILPLLPLYDISRGKIYFSDISKTGWLSLFSYDINTASVEQIASGSSHLFSPVFLGNMLICGGSVDSIAGGGGVKVGREMEIEFPLCLTNIFT